MAVMTIPYELRIGWRYTRSARTAETLGTERAGHGVLIGERGLVLTIGYLVTEANDVELTLLFDPEHDLEERILKEQFAP